MLNIREINVDIEEIRKNAPDGATHWLIGGLKKMIIYFDVNNELIMTKKGWCLFHIDDVFMDKIKPL